VSIEPTSKKTALSISLVIPVYNEEKIIKNTILSVKTYMENNFKNNFIEYEVIFIDDTSKDATLKIADETIETIGGNIKTIHHEKNTGKGGAVRTGMLAAHCDVIFYTDCDLAYGLDVIKEGYDIFAQNKEADIVIGSRRKHKDGYSSYTFLRKIMSIIFFNVLKIYGGIKETDSQTGFKGFKKDIAKKIFGLCETNGWAFDVEVLLIAQRLKLKILEMPVKIINHGESKIKAVSDGAKMLKEISRIKKRVKKLDI